MSNLKEQLIRLGSESPELQKHLRPVLEHLNRTSNWRSGLSVEAQIGFIKESLFPWLQRLTTGYRPRFEGRLQEDIDQMYDDLSKLFNLRMTYPDDRQKVIPQFRSYHRKFLALQRQIDQAISQGEWAEFVIERGLNDRNLIQTTKEYVQNVANALEEMLEILSERGLLHASLRVELPTTSVYAAARQARNQREFIEPGSTPYGRLGKVYNIGGWIMDVGPSASRREIVDQALLMTQLGYHVKFSPKGAARRDWGMYYDDEEGVFIVEVAGGSVEEYTGGPDAAKRAYEGWVRDRR